MAQREMFSDEEIDNKVLDHIGDLPEGSAAWPAMLLELHGVVANELKQAGIETPDLPLKVVMSIGEYMGGMQVYLPRGDKLKQQIRDMEIFNEFNGRNVPQLAKRHHLTSKTIYEIIARMRQVETQRRQFSLFE
ncbi:Mor transcription activator family protein [Vibrio parahaemolyticus]|uniref:Mor transcription activator family protein n=1 Tax=Vibrio parahaemolyticus TaxID=670 RepID=UPI0015DD9BFC|nr:Mor transcription activator family protein [Vibrio parahaemolyticus]MBE4040025.1 transcriptional regulator [Vibrio parahaemolyticus]